MNLASHLRSHVRSLLLLLGLVLAIPTAATTNTPASAPRRGGTLHLRLGADWNSLDPATAYDSESAPILRLLFRTLLRYDYDYNIQTDEAESWQVSPDSRTYTFRLRDDIRFASGRRVTADDYVCALERILDQSTRSPGKNFYLPIRGAQEFNAGTATRVAGLSAPDERTLVIELDQPSFTFPYMLCMPFASAVPRERIRQYGKDFRHHLEGSGAYVLREWKRDSHWKFSRNPHYAGTNAWVDAIEVAIGGDVMFHAMQLERGEIDRALLSPILARRFRRDPALATWIRLIRPVNVGYLWLNNQVKPFDDVRVRRAINHAIDRQRVNRATGGLTVPSAGIVPESMPWSNPRLHRYEYDPARARALLREAGFPDGFRSTLWHILGDIDRLVVAGIQQDLAQVGIQLELQPVEMSAIEVAARTPGQVPCGFWGWLQDYPDPANYIEALLHGRNIGTGSNFAFFNHPGINQAIDDACATLDREQRFERFRDVENRILQEAPWVPIYNMVLPFAFHPRVRGHRAHPVFLHCYEDLWIDPAHP